MIVVAWIIFFGSGLCLFAMFLSKLPLVERRQRSRHGLVVAADSLFEYSKQKVRQLGRWVWHFVLEAKDIKPPSIGSSVEHVKNVFKIRIRQSDKDPNWMPEVSQNSSPVAAHKTPEDMYLETIKKDRNNRPAYEGLGRLYLQEKRFADAAEIFEFLTKQNATRDVYWSNYGIALYAEKKYREAVRAYEQALKINDKIAARWINLSLCLEALDEHEKSIKALGRAINLDPRNITYLSMLADVYEKVKNKLRTEEVLSEILSIDPTNKPVRERLMKLRI